MLAAYEKLGAFYLGRRKGDPAPFLLEANDLLTHGVIVGMTGSGKTGLAVALLEEAAIDGIPAIVVDPKGDLSNLLLTFPSLAETDFAPWVNDGRSAAQEASAWREGLRAWDQDGERIGRLQASREVRVFTPGSDAGIPLAMLASLAAPAEATRRDAEAMRARVQATVSSLLGWLDIEGNAQTSREHMLLTAIAERAWSVGEDLDLARLITRVQEPAFDKLGVLDLEAMFPKKERFSLAMKLNGLLASPGFELWMRGEPLDVGALLFPKSGKPGLSVISIAHLNDAERMFVVTALLHAVVAWMRTQSGTQSLRALLYMDEIAGTMPPVANPPSKAPLLLLMKQARAFGLGVVLATQNPVDLDYKALSNAGVWFLGRLQTERDKLRVLDGLEGALAGGATRAQLDSLLSGLGKRNFLVHDIHAKGPEVIETRWAMSYLRGPLTKDELRRAQVAPASTAAVAKPVDDSGQSSREKPALGAGIPEMFLPTSGTSPRFRAALVGAASVRFVDKKSGVDVTRDVVFQTPFAAGPISAHWEDAQWVSATKRDFGGAAPSGAQFQPLPISISAKSLSTWQKAFVTWLVASQGLSNISAPSVDEMARPDEPEDAFRARITNSLREKRDAAVAQLRTKYTPKFDALKTKIEAAHASLAKERSDVSVQQVSTVADAGALVMGAFLGSRRGLVRSAATAVKDQARMGKQKGDVVRAEQKLAELNAKWVELDRTFQAEAAEVTASLSPERVQLETIVVRPKKSDIAVTFVGVGWIPEG